MPAHGTKLPPPHPVDPRLIGPFVRAARLVMGTMTGLPTAAGPAADVRLLAGAEYDYSGIIGFTGGIVGMVAVRFQQASAAAVVEAFAKAPIAPETADFADALGELTNMIAGAAKKDLGLPASIGIPNVVMGAGHVLARPSDVPCVTIPCDAGGNPFAIELSLRLA